MRWQRLLPVVDCRLSAFEAWRAFAQRAPQAASGWLERLKVIDEAAIARVLEEIPPQRMSKIRRDFTTQLLMGKS
jgi:hypothetical protein